MKEIYDAHTHLNSDQLSKNREQHLKDFIEIWGKGLVNIWVNNKWNKIALTIAKEQSFFPTRIEKLSNNNRHGGIGTTLWLHPGETTWWEISSLEKAKEEIEELKTLINENKDYVRAIWECGIDSHYERNNHIEEIQIYLFEEQCKLADKLHLPIVIHSRSNFELSYNIIKQYPQLKVYFHCRSYSPEEVKKLHETLPHLRIGFCGNLTYPKAHNLKESFAYIIEHNSQHSNRKIQRLLETDAPYLSPQKVRGTENVPAHIIHLYNRVEELYPMTKVSEACKEHFLNLYIKG